MSKSLRAIGIVGLSLLVFSCPLPQMAGVSGPAVTPPVSGPSGAMAPRVMTDASRNQAVYVDENGRTIDIVSQEPDGTQAASTEAVGLVVIPDASAAGKSLSVVGGGGGGNGAGSSGGGAGNSTGGGDGLRALIVGSRSDGRGGVWVILRNGTVLGAGSESGNQNSSLLPEGEDRDHGMHAWMGWTYTVTGISDDGLVVIGQAVNKNGFQHGDVTIDPGTAVGVYWRVTKVGHRPWIKLAPARVIGTVDLSSLPAHGHRWLQSLVLKKLVHLKTFFLNYFSAYLTSADSIDTLTAGAYRVHGTDQDGNRAIAVINPDNTVAITPVTTTALPDLVVSSIQVPSGAQSPSAAWTLGATVTNSGTADAGSFTLLYQLSTKSTLDSTATTIGTSTVSSLAAGASFADTFSSSYSISQSGNHWIFVTADSTNAVAESNKTNNTSDVLVPILYPRIVINTYQPTTSPASAVDTFVSLFGAAGDTTIDLPDLWNTDRLPYTTETGAIAEDGGRGRYGSVDYGAGLAPGTYYVRVRAALSSHQGGYGIRVLTVAADSPTGSTWPWYFSATNPTDANPAGGSYEPDDNPLQGGVPTNPVAIAINQKLNRWLTPGNIAAGIPGDVDWFILTLP